MLGKNAPLPSTYGISVKNRPASAMSGFGKENLGANNNMPVQGIGVGAQQPGRFQASAAAYGNIVPSGNQMLAAISARSGQKSDRSTERR